MRTDRPSDTWRLDVVEDLEFPGWFQLPTDLDDAGRAAWTDACAAEVHTLLASDDPEVEVVGDDDVRRLLAAALELRATSPSLAIFQVWPVSLPATVQCHVNILASADLPDWSTVGDAVVLFPIEAEHIGPGLQLAVRRTVVDEGETVELMSLHYVFDDGDATLMLSLEESLPPLIGAALPGLVGLKDTLRMVREDGTPFVSRAPEGVEPADIWPMADPR